MVPRSQWSEKCSAVVVVVVFLFSFFKCFVSLSNTATMSVTIAVISASELKVPPEAQVTPYVEIEYAKTKRTTTTAAESSEPTWNEQFSFDFIPGEDEMSFDVFLPGGVFVGRALLSFAKFGTACAASVCTPNCVGFHQREYAFGQPSATRRRMRLSCGAEANSSMFSHQGHVYRWWRLCVLAVLGHFF